MLPVLGIVCIGAACLAGRRGPRRGRAQRRGCASLPTKYAAPCAGQVCEDLPWLGEQVTQTMIEAYQRGEKRPEALTVYALRAHYSVGPSGQALRWPTTYADCDQMKVLESRTMLRAQRLIAEVLDMEAEQIWRDGGGY